MARKVTSETKWTLLGSFFLNEKKNDVLCFLSFLEKNQCKQKCFL